MHLPEVMGQEAENQYIGHGLCRERLGSHIPLSRIQSTVSLAATQAGK